MPENAVAAALEAALVRELRALWKQLNDSHFKDALALPAFEIVPSRAHLGRWVRDTRMIEISRPLVLEQSWGAVVEVMKHEMAHQYVYEVLGEEDEAPHGPAFRATCARLGIDVRASGVPQVPASSDEERIVTRIAKLLALAESSNRHEAEAAMAAAQKLMLRYNIDVAGHGGAAARGYAHRQLGTPTGRVSESERILAMILGKHFFVEVIWVPVYRAREGKRGSVVEVCGTDANLAMAEYVHAFLTHAAERLWEEHKRARGIRSNMERRTYLAGVMTGFAEKLARQARAHHQEGLVWVKDGDLAGFFRRRHPYVRHVRHAGNRRTEAYAHGKEAGRRIVLHRGVAGAAASRGRLLGP
jgi:hypothetical protein